MKLDSFIISNSNPLPRLSELKLKVNQVPDRNKAELNPTLTIGEAEILPHKDDDHNFSFNISLKKAELKIICDGAEVDDEEKLGEKLKEFIRGASSGIISVDEHENLDKSSSVEGGVEASKVKISIRGRLNKNQKTDRNETKHNHKEFHIEPPKQNVVSKGGDVWVIKDILNGTLDGKYLEGRRLCLITLKETSNRTFISGLLYCAVRDIDLTIQENDPIFYKRKNTEKMIKTLLGRHLKSLNEIDDNKKPGDLILLSFSYAEDTR